MVQCKSAGWRIFFEGKLFSRVFVYILTIECRKKSGSKDEKRAMFIENAKAAIIPVIISAIKAYVGE